MPYADEPMAAAERVTVQPMIDDGKLWVPRKAERAAVGGTRAGKADGVTAEGQDSPGVSDCLSPDGPWPPTGRQCPTENGPSISEGLWWAKEAP